VGEYSFGRISERANGKRGGEPRLQKALPENKYLILVVVPGLDIADLGLSCAA
jgi:hypothetical protein